MVSIGLEHEWDLGLQLGFVYGAQWARPVYDGDRERRFEVHAGFEWRVR